VCAAPKLVFYHIVHPSGAKVSEGVDRDLDLRVQVRLPGKSLDSGRKNLQNVVFDYAQAMADNLPGVNVASSRELIFGGLSDYSLSYDLINIGIHLGMGQKIRLVSVE
jgi:hypothetical protein